MNKKILNTPIHNENKVICKLGLDVHAQTIMVARQIEGTTPQPPQRIASNRFLDWIKGQLAQGYQLISCYEAGPTGYWLHRELTALGVTNYVVCPTKLDSRGKGVNTDKTDALELLVRLDRFVAGNKKSFSIVTVPTPEQEQKRQLTRQREQIRRTRLALSAQGRMLMLANGTREGNHWWKKNNWEKLVPQLPAWLTERLECFKRIIENLNQEITDLTKTISKQAPSHLPQGMGQLTHQILEAEIRDWKRFNNPRQISSYSGLTGGRECQRRKKRGPEHHQSGQPPFKLLPGRMRLAHGVQAARLLFGKEMGESAPGRQSPHPSAQASHRGFCAPTAR
jgi:transposase